MQINGKLLLIVSESKKQPGRIYNALCVDLGYSKKFLTFDSYVIAELLDISVQELHSLDIGEYDVEI